LRKSRNCDLAEAPALAGHEGVDLLVLLARDAFLAEEDGAEAELLLIRAGVDQRAVVEEDVRLAAVAARRRQRAAAAGGVEKRQHLRQLEGVEAPLKDGRCAHGAMRAL
jgi:hypothetical protein